MQTNKKTDEKFSKDATKLVKEIIKNLQKIQNLSITHYVEDEHKEQIISRLRKEIDTTKKTFKELKSDDDFKLD